MSISFLFNFYCILLQTANPVKTMLVLLITQWLLHCHNDKGTYPLNLTIIRVELFELLVEVCVFNTNVGNLIDLPVAHLYMY